MEVEIIPIQFSNRLNPARKCGIYCTFAVTRNGWETNKKRFSVSWNWNQQKITTKKHATTAKIKALLHKVVLYRFSMSCNWLIYSIYCELLSKVCIFDILSNKEYADGWGIGVVNCFQKFVSLIFWATSITWKSNMYRLWIAFKSLYLWYSEQPIIYINHFKNSCELLSKVCIFDILSNEYCKLPYTNQLWIAFKSLYLWYSEQQQPKPNNNGKCCELLSKVCIFDILSNENQQINKSCLVVNCFQKFVSLIFWATSVEYNYRIFELWIAFKSLYLWYSEQLRSSYRSNGRSCELLSKVCIFDILSNHQGESAFTIELWIAFKSLYLWYSEQHTTGTSNQDIRCELLSKVCIFDILSNQQANIELMKRLWIAFKSLYLWYSEQHSLPQYKEVKGCELLSKVCIFDILSNH